MFHCVPCPNIPTQGITGDRWALHNHLVEGKHFLAMRVGDYISTRSMEGRMTKRACDIAGTRTKILSNMCEVAFRDGLLENLCGTYLVF